MKPQMVLTEIDLFAFAVMLSLAAFAATLAWSGSAETAHLRPICRLDASARECASGSFVQSATGRPTAGAVAS
jgi:hypothetical protein